MDDRAAALEAAWREVDIADGTLRPEFVQVPDGFYTKRVVLDELPAARFHEPDELPDPAPASHYEPCRLPRYRTELVWERVS